MPRAATTARSRWSIDPLAGPSLLTGRALSEIAEDAWFDGTLHASDRVKELTTVAQVEFDKRPAYQVKVVHMSGVEQMEYYDVETGLQIGSESQRETPMGVLPMKGMLREYQKFGGLKQPTVLVQSTMGIEQVLRITSYEYNDGAGHRVRSAARDQSAHQVTRSRRVAVRADHVPRAARVALPHPERRPAQAWRAQALASFDEVWQTVHDTFFDPTFGGLDWDAVKAELRPKGAGRGFGRGRSPDHPRHARPAAPITFRAALVGVRGRHAAGRGARAGRDARRAGRARDHARGAGLDRASKRGCAPAT